MSDEKIISAKNKKGTNAEHPEILPIVNKIKYFNKL